MIDEAEGASAQAIEYDFGPRCGTDPLARLATAMERIAAVMERLYAEDEPDAPSPDLSYIPGLNVTAGGTGGGSIISVEIGEPTYDQYKST